MSLAFFKKHLRNNWSFYLIYPISILAFSFYVLYDNTPPHWDAGRHLYNAQQYWQLLKNIFVTSKENGHTDAISAFFQDYYYYPPLAYWVVMPFMAILGRTYQAALFGNVIWLSLLSFSWFGWSRLVGFSKMAQSITLMFLLSSPFIIGNSRELQLDVPILAILLGFLYSLERLIQKITYPNIVLFAASLSCGFLVKWSFVVYAPILLGLYALRFFWINRTQVKLLTNSKVITKLIIFIYIITTSLGALAGSWYLPNLTRLKLDLTQNGSATGISEGDPQGITLESLVFYLKVIVNEHFWLLWMLFVVILTATCLWKAGKIKIFNWSQNYAKLVFVTTLGLSNLVVMMLYHLNQGNKDTRYVVVFYLSWAIMIALLVELTQKIYFDFKSWEVLRKIIWSGSAIIFGINLLSLTLPIGAFELVINKANRFPVVVVGNHGYTNFRSRREDWAVYKALTSTSNLKTLYLQKSDSCISQNYFNPKLTIGVDFEPMPMHTNYGTVWGLAEQYGLEIANLDDPCFILVGRSIDTKSINITKYQQKFEEVARFSDSPEQNLNMVLLKKR